MKKLFAILIALTCITLAFTACEASGGNTSQIKNSTSNTINVGENNNSIVFDVATNKLLSDIQSVAGEVDYEEYTNLKRVLKRITPSVVEVYATNGVGVSAGSGVVIGVSSVDLFNENDSVESASSSADADGSSSAPVTEEFGVKSYVVTCHHVIEGATDVTIKTTDGNEYQAYFVGSDPDSDICVMSVNVRLQPVQFYTDTDNLEVGESVVAIGNPLGTLGGTVTSGIVSSASREIIINGTKMNLIQTDAAINSGNSGGGLFTSTGFFIGMVNAKYESYLTDIDGLGFAIPGNTIMDTTEQLVETSTDLTPGYIPGKYQLGCTVSDVYANRWGSQINVVIASLDESGSFYKSGLRVGDVIKSVTYKGETYYATNSHDFIAYINSFEFEIGEKITFSVTRADTSMTIEVVVSQYIYYV